MAIQAHLVELERKHKSLENELHEALVHLSTDDLEIAELKRRKLMVKDEIERLKHQRLIKPATPCSRGPWIIKSCTATCGGTIFGRMPE